MSTVQVLCPNGRRVNIKVSPNTPLLSVLVDACQKQGLDPQQHALKHQRKVLNVSQMFRYSGLPNNVKLEVVASSNYPRKEEPVRVAVQLQSGDRLQGVFPPAVSLWELMCSLHGNDQWIAGEAIIVYMRREVCGVNKLKETSLRDLGIASGSVVLRLIHRQQQEGSQLAMDTSESTLDHSADNVIVEHYDSHDQAVSSSTGSHATSFNDPVVYSEHETPVATESRDPSSHDTAPCNSVITGSRDATAEEPVAIESRDPTATSSHTTISCDPITSRSHDTATESHNPSSHVTISCDPVTSGSHDTDTAISKPVAAGSTTSLHDPNTSGSQVIKSSHDLSSLLKDAHKQSSARQNEGSCDRQVVVFNVTNHSSDAIPITELPDSFFDVTVDDCAVIQRGLHQKVKRLTDAPLTTVALRQATLYERYSRYSKATIRVQFPDLWVLQGSFHPHESLRALVQFVREHLADPTIKFYLYTTPPKTVLTNGKLTLVEAGLVPASIVHFGLHDNKGGVEFLKSSLLEEASSPLEANVIAMVTRDNPNPNSESPMEISSSNDAIEATTNPILATTTMSQQTTHSREKGAVTSKAVPKWFKHSGGKKL